MGRDSPLKIVMGIETEKNRFLKDRKEKFSPSVTAGTD
jgi:hypothetical protein